MSCKLSAIVAATAVALAYFPDPAGAQPVAAWSKIHADNANGGVGLDVSPPEQRGEVLVFPGSGAPILGSPTVAAGRVYFGDDDGKVHCLNAATLAELWVWAPPAIALGSVPSVRSSVTIAGERAYVVSRDRRLRCLNAATGAVIFQKAIGAFWDMSEPTFATDGWIDASPTVHGGSVYVGARDGKVRSFDEVTGTLQWETPLGVGELIVSTPALLDDGGDTYLYVIGSSVSGRIYCLDASDGSIVWDEEIQDSNPLVAHPGPAWGSVSVGYSGTTPYLYFTTDPSTGAIPEYRVFCYHALDQRLLDQFVWSYDIAANEAGCYMPATPAIHDGWLYLPTGRGFFRLGMTNPTAPGWYAADYGQHLNAWASAAVGTNASGAAFVYYVSNENHQQEIVCRNAGDGSTRWIYNGLAGDMETSSPALYDGRLYAGTIDGRLLSISGSVSRSAPVVETAAAEESVRVSGNPARGTVSFAWPSPNRVDAVEIVDVTGRSLVREQAADGRWAWDGRTAAGPPAHAGVYFLRVAGRDHSTHRFVWLGR